MSGHPNPHSAYPKRAPSDQRVPGPAGPVFRGLGVLTLIASGFVIAASPGAAAIREPTTSLAPSALSAGTGMACAEGEGVTVVVDFGDLGGVSIACAPGVQADGFAALAAAGFLVDSDTGPANTVCKINGAPTQGFPYCWTTGGFWSYWKKPWGGAWTMSRGGAAGGPLAIDSVEGWRWAGGFSTSPPSEDETAAPATTTTSTSVATTAPATSSPATSTPASTSAPAPSGPISSTTAVTESGASTPSTSAGPADPSGLAPTPPGYSAVPRLPTPGASRPASGRPTALARTGVDLGDPLAGAVIAVLVGGMALVARKRRNLTSA